jgi:esterase/lipase
MILILIRFSSTVVHLVGQLLYMQLQIWTAKYSNYYFYFIKFISKYKNYQNIAGIIIENSFTSIPDMVDAIMPMIAMFKFMVSNVWPSLKNIHKIKNPMFFIMSMKDELVPPSMMASLFDKATGAIFKEKVILSN